MHMQYRSCTSSDHATFRVWGGVNMQGIQFLVKNTGPTLPDRTHLICGLFTTHLGTRHMVGVQHLFFDY